MNLVLSGPPIASALAETDELEDGLRKASLQPIGTAHNAYEWRLPDRGKSGLPAAVSGHLCVLLLYQRVSLG